MLLKNLRVKNWKNQILNLSIGDILEGFFIKDIQGLGPVKATLSTSSSAGLDGAQYHASRLESRNIIIKLGLDPNGLPISVSELRSKLYDFFMPKTNAKLNFILSEGSDTLDRVIDGHIEYNEPDVFTKEPTVDVSIMCFNPLFADPEPKSHSFSTSTLSTPGASFVYEGNVDTGALIKILFNRSVSSGTRIDIRHKYLGVTKAMHLSHPSYPPGYSFQSGDVLEISTVRGSKYVRVIRGGITTAILYAFAPISEWISLGQGLNEIGVQVSGNPIPYTVEYVEKYGGL
jgi:hypothetical protein